MKIKISAIIDLSREVLTVIQKSVLQEIKDSIHYLVSHKDIRFIINMLFVLFASYENIVLDFIFLG